MTAKDIRQIAWCSLSGNWGWAILACIVATMLGGASAFASGSSVQVNIGTDSQGISIPSIAKLFSDSNTSPTLIILLFMVGLLALTALITYIIAAFCVASTVEVGYSHFNIDLVDGKSVEFVRIFSFFRHFWKAVVANLLRTMFIFLWSLLFIIPGIIAAYRYSMVPFILADNPNMSPEKAIEHSKYIMQGNKWRLFCLQFSFIGWDLLCVVTFGILNIWIVPYKHAALAAFYRSLVPAISQDEEFEFEENDEDTTTLI